MNLKVPGAILPLGSAILSTRAKTVRGVVATPLLELGLKVTLPSRLLCILNDAEMLCIFFLNRSPYCGSPS